VGFSGPFIFSNIFSPIISVFISHFLFSQFIPVVISLFIHLYWHIYFLVILYYFKISLLIHHHFGDFPHCSCISLQDK
jgi:hypothetical protein